MSNGESTQGFAPYDAKTGKPIDLAMQKLWLVGRIMGVGARLLVKHVFRSGEKKPLEVIYSFMLPRDAALRRFRVTGDGFSVTSELKPVKQAVEEYEEALAEGHLATMARQYRDGMINLTIGNIRPGEEVAVNLEIIAGVETRDDGIRFRFPFTLAPVYHAGARAAEVAPGVGEIELPEDEFGDVVMPQFVADASALHQVGFDLSVSMGHPIVEAGSPSHPVRVVGQGIGRSRVSLATAKDLPDRDLVLDIRTSEKVEGVVAGTGSKGRGHFAAVIPSSAFKAEGTEAEKEEPRSVIFLLDRSGSMQGAPLEQARNAVCACLGALGGKDKFGIIAFDSSPEVLGAGLVEATMDNREKAGADLAKVGARGGTELAAGIRAAADLLKKANAGGGDIMVLTDGQVGGTEDILDIARANGIRLHCLGIGSASQDRFLTLLARETGGVSRFVTPRERVDMSAVELFAAVGRPLGSGLTARVEGLAKVRIAPEVPSHIFAGTPIVVLGDAAGAGEGRLVLEWEAGGAKRSLEVPVRIGAGGEGETVRLLQGARLITDVESRYGGEAYGDEGRSAKHEAKRIKKHLIALSEAYGLASREMGLVAVVVRAGDQPGDLPVTKVVPVGLAQDVAMEAYFNPTITQAQCSDLDMMTKPAWAKHARHAPAKEMLSISLQRYIAFPGQDRSSRLVVLAACLEPDGGMPGKNHEERIQETIAALLQFLAGGHDMKAGAFRNHVKRMVEFLEKTLQRAKPGLEAIHQFLERAQDMRGHDGGLLGLMNEEFEHSVSQVGGTYEKSRVRFLILEEIVDRARTGNALNGEWAELKPGSGFWDKLAKAVSKAQGG